MAEHERDRFFTAHMPQQDRRSSKPLPSNHPQSSSAHTHSHGETANDWAVILLLQRHLLLLVQLIQNLYFLPQGLALILQDGFG